MRIAINYYVMKHLLRDYYWFVICFLVTLDVRISLAKQIEVRPPRYRTLYACEGSSLEIVCEEGAHINLIRANFGRFSISVCNDNGNVQWSVDCMSHRSFRVMQESCGTKRSCTLPASSNVFGDPCPGTLKYLEAHYQCMPDQMQFPYSTSRPQHFIKNPLNPLYDRSRESYRKNVDQTTGSSPNPRIVFPETFQVPVLSFPQQSSGKEDKSRTENINSNNNNRKTTETSDDNNYSQAYDENLRFNNNDIPPPNVPPIIYDNEAPIVSALDKDQQYDKSENQPTLHHHSSTQQPVNKFDNTANNEERTHDFNTDDNNDNEKIDNNEDGNHYQNNYIAHYSDLAIDHCAQNYSRGLYWNWTLAGHVAVQPCPDGSKGLARWSCSYESGTPKWMPPMPDMSECSSWWIANLESRINTGTESVVLLADELAKNCKEKILFGGDLFRVTDIINQLAARMEVAIEGSNEIHRSHVVRELLNSVQDVVSNLLDDNQLESWLELSNKEQRLAITSMMHTLEKLALLLADTKTKTSDYIRAHHNIFLSIHVRTVSSLNNGLHLPPFAEPLDEAMPESVTSITNSVYLGQQSLIEQSTPSGLTKVVFLMYKKLAQFLKPDIETMGHYPVVMTSDGDMTQLNITRIINSDIIGVLLNCERYTPLSEPIEFTLKHVNTRNVTNAKCVFWDIERREWSQQGCETLSSNQTHTNCKCNHLTNFAILMDINDTPLSRSNELALRVITFVGCIISIICLAFTFVTLISFRSLKNDRNTIHTNLCLCLIIAESIFLLGISQTQHKLICGLIAIALHYFFLASFLWMFFEGFQLYVMLIEVFDHEKSRINWYFLLSYGMPAIMVIISAIIDPLSYGTPKYCWLRSDNYFIWVFVGPVIAILMANVVFLAIAFTAMCRHISHVSTKTKEQTKLTSTNGENINVADIRRINIKVWIRGSLALVFLLGLTWTFGVLYISQETVFMAYLFTITNSLQGLFIFIFNCLTNEKVRVEYRRLFSTISLVPICLEASSHSKSGDTCREQVPSSVPHDQRASLYLSSSTNSNTTKESSITTTSTSTNSQPLISGNCMNAVSTARASAPVTVETPTLTRSSFRKYYLTDDSSDYGCKRLEQNVSHKHSSRDIYSLHSHHPHLMSHPPSFIEHIYECIDEDPYVAKLLLPAIHRSLDGQHARTLSDSSRHSDNRPLISSTSSPINHNYQIQGSNNGHLPAIVRDNTANKTTIICSSQPTVALLNGDQVICCTLNDHQLCDHQLPTNANHLMNIPMRQQFLVANSLNNLNCLQTSKNRHLSSDC